MKEKKIYTKSVIVEIKSLPYNMNSFSYNSNITMIKAL